MKTIIFLFFIAMLSSCATSNYRLTDKELENARYTQSINKAKQKAAQLKQYHDVLEKLAKKNDAIAMYLYGNTFLTLEQPKFRRAFEKLTKLRLTKKAILLLDNEFGKATFWLLKASNKGVKSADFSLKILPDIYQRISHIILGVDKRKPDYNKEKLAKLLKNDIKQFALKGDALAQYLYAETLKKVVIAKEYQNNHSEAMLKKVYQLKKQALKKAIPWYEKAAKNNLTPAQMALVSVYYVASLEKPSNYVRRYDHEFADKQKGLYWLKILAEKNNLLAMRLLASAYIREYDTFNPKIEKAAQYLSFILNAPKDSISVDIDANFKLGYIYFNLKKDFKKAFKHYHYIAEYAQPLDEDDKSRIALAQMAVGVMFAEGKGVKKDNKKSQYWLDKAQDNGSVEASKLSINVFIRDALGIEDKNKP